MNLGQYGHFTQVVLGLAAEDQTPPTPTEVFKWAEEGFLYEKVIERAMSVGVDASAFAALVNGTDRDDFAEQTGSWANVIDPERKYGLAWGGSHGWLTLIWLYVDMVNSHAAQADVR